jgi:hypothetical protein
VTALDPRSDRWRNFRDLVDLEAPLSPSRATAVMVAVAREVERLECSGRAVGRIRAEDVYLAPDGSVSIASDVAPPAVGGIPGADGSEGGASIGWLLFELLTGRRPLGVSDAVEPTIRESYRPEVCSLVLRSFSGSPGQWPDGSAWRTALESQAGGLAPPLPPRQARSDRRRRLAVVFGVVILVIATVAALLLAPRWWDTATDAAGSDATDLVVGGLNAFTYLL